MIEAFEKLVRWILDFVDRAFNTIFAPVIQAWQSYSTSVSRAANFMFTRNSCAPIECNVARAFKTFLETLMAPGFFYVVLGLMTFVRVTGAWIATATAGLTSLSQKIGESIMPAVIGGLFGLVVGGLAAAASYVIERIFFSSIPETSTLWKEQRALAVLSLFSIGIQWVLSWPSMSAGVAVDARAIVLAVGGLLLGVVALAFKNDRIVSFLLAGTGLVLSLLGLLLASKKILKTKFADDWMVNAFEFVPPAMTLVAFLMSTVNFASAASKLVT